MVIVFLMFFFSCQQTNKMFSKQKSSCKSFFFFLIFDFHFKTVLFKTFYLIAQSPDGPKSLQLQVCYFFNSIVNRQYLGKIKTYKTHVTDHFK